MVACIPGKTCPSKWMLDRYEGLQESWTKYKQIDEKGRVSQCIPRQMVGKFRETPDPSKLATFDDEYTQHLFNSKG